MSACESLRTLDRVGILEGMNAGGSHRKPDRLFFAALALSSCGIAGGGREQQPATAVTIGGVGVVAADVTGMEPQLAIIRRDAARLGWRITCEGSAGEERVLRLTIPAGSGAEVRSYFDPQDQIGSSTRFYTRENLPPEGCDQEPPTTSSSGPSPVLAIGPRALLAPLADVARACGFTLAVIRERRREDVPQGASGLQDDWLTLDAGEDISPRYGPEICFLQMQSRAAVTNPR